jgi:lipopolysaccharide/colanic/teichoic acid biosynthesis glycosyltransferase
MCSDRVWRSYIIALVVADAVLLGLAFIVAALVRNAVEIVDFVTNQPDLDPIRYGLVAALVIPGLLGIFWLRQAYARQNLLGGPEEYACVAGGCAYGTLLVIAASYLYGSTPVVSRGWLLLFWLLATAFVCIGRFSLRRVAYALRRKGWFIRRVLIAGVGDQGMAIAQQLHGPSVRGVKVVGFLDDYLATGLHLVTWPADRDDPESGNCRVVGHPRDALALAARYACDLLIIVPSALTWESQQRFADLSGAMTHGPEIRIAPTQYDLTSAGVEPAPLGYIPLLRLQPARITGVDAVIRASVDVVVAALLLVVMTPVLAWVVVSARMRGIHPIVSCWHVLGEGSRPVTLRLLDRRVTDRLLLCGLPALLAVLRGQLALAGPRPVPVEKHAEYRRWAGVLFAVKPGLIGPWRLADPGMPPDEQVLADVWWVRNWSIWQHLFVLLQTARRTGVARRHRQTLMRWNAGVPPVERPDTSLVNGLLPSSSR